ncbi:MAG: AbrB/MazE/SpoVT family DNA-binding domain-containing protein [Calditrichota bacterium]
MTTRIQKWGNSLALRIPKPFAEEAGFAPDTLVDIQISDGALIVTAAVKQPSLDELLAGVNEDNRPTEFDFGARTGRETW